jgi:hypothetical protein
MTRTIVFSSMSLVCALAMTAWSPRAEGVSADAPRPEDAVVARFTHPTTPRLVSYRALRRMKASAMGGRVKAELDAWTTLDAAGRFSYDVVREEGSDLVRTRVLREALDTERDNYAPGQLGRMDLVPANYEFRPQGRIGGDLVEIALRPRRSTPLLLRGVATVQASTGDVVRIEGSPSESPSWWTRQVEIVQRYDRIGGVQVPVEISSTATVRVAGTSTFQMLYQYESVNGRAVNGSRE